MIITISGVPGAGKTSTGKYLAEKLGYNFYSMGDVQGKVALQMGITIDELMKRARTDTNIHKKVDEYQRQLGENQQNFVCDGWLSFRWMPHSFKIILKASPEVAGKRVFEEQKSSKSRKDEKAYATLEETIAEQKERFDVVRQSFMNQYSVDILDEKHYDLCVDSSDLTVQQAGDLILKRIMG